MAVASAVLTAARSSSDNRPMRAATSARSIVKSLSRTIESAWSPAAARSEIGVSLGHDESFSRTHGQVVLAMITTAGRG